MNKMLGIRNVAAIGFCLVATTLLGGCAGDGGAKPAKDSSAAPTSFAFWPPFPADPKVQFLRTFESSNDLVPKQHSNLEQVVFGKELEKAADINKPYGVAMHDGKIYVCDMRGKSVFIFDLKKKQTRIMGTSGAHALSHPVGVAVGDDGTVFVADNTVGAIFVFDANERYSRAIGFPKFKPSALAVHGDRLYACDLTSQLVHVFETSTGKHVGEIGSVGDEDGQFRLPVGVAVDPAGNVIAIDMMRCRLQRFSPDGKFISATGSMGDQAGMFARPKYLAADKDGIVYAVDAAFQNVQMFDDQNRMLMNFGAAGDHPGAMNQPVGICVSEEGLEYFKDFIHPGFQPKRLVLVTNQFGDAKVSVYAMGEIKKGYTAQDLAAASAKIATGQGAKQEVQDFQMQAGQGEPGGEGGEESSGEGAAPAEPKTPPKENPK